MGDNEALVIKIQSGENIRQNKELLFNNIYDHVKKEILVHYGHRSDIEDLIQDGCLIVLEMIKTFDHTRGASFLGYVRKYLIYKLERERTQKDSCFIVSHSMQRDIKNYKYFCNKFKVENGKDPQPIDIISGLGIGKEKLERIKNSLNFSNGISYNREIKKDGESVELCELIKDTDTDIENEIINKVYGEDLKKDIWQCINTLENEKREIIIQRYIEGKPLTEIADRLGIPRTVIYGYEKRILQSMKHNRYIRHKLLPYLENETIHGNAIKGTGIYKFNNTWTSSTERVAIKNTEIKKELLSLIRK